ncbi:MAG: Uma2 family endonuclease [Chloroflexi bacterium]|nr:Uma2 family endonuclease [Chloroflexota bacterium]
MSVTRRYTVSDLEQIEAVEGWRYEVIDGELCVSKQPSWHHQYASDEIQFALRAWSRASGLGIPISAPGIIFDAEDAVAPDLVWVSAERLVDGVDAAGHFTHASELIVEVLSPGAANERRDRERKLALYSREDVVEYWIVDWQRRTVQVYRRVNASLQLVQTLAGDALLESPLLPGFRLVISRIWPPAR